MKGLKKAQKWLLSWHTVHKLNNWTFHSLVFKQYTLLQTTCHCGINSSCCQHSLRSMTWTRLGKSDRNIVTLLWSLTRGNRHSPIKMLTSSLSLPSLIPRLSSSYQRARGKSLIRGVQPLTSGNWNLAAPIRLQNRIKWMHDHLWVWSSLLSLLVRMNKLNE